MIIYFPLTLTLPKGREDFCLTHQIKNMKYLIPFLFVLCLGCSSVTPPKVLKNTFANNRPKTPGRMVAFWQCYTQTNPNGGEPLRGVGGRLQFYTEKNSKDPVKVDGELTIYLFDANDPVPQRSVPVKHAIFKKDALPAFYRQDDAGMNGYDVFVPVDEIGNYEMDLQVIAVFREIKKPGKTAALVNTHSAKVTLPGPKREEILREFSGDDSQNSATTIDLAGGREETGKIIQASHNRPERSEAIQLNDATSQRRKSATIELPDHFTTAYRNSPVPEPQMNSDSASQKTSPYAVAKNEPVEVQAVNETPPATSNSSGSWLRTPSRFSDISRRQTETTSTRAFRIDSNTRPPLDAKPVYEEVSESGVSSKVIMGPVTR